MKHGSKDVEENFMTSILINSFPPSYKHFMETLQIINKLEVQTLDSLGDLLVQHDKNFGNKKTFSLPTQEEKNTLEEEVDTMKIQEVVPHTMTIQEEEAHSVKQEEEDSKTKNLVVAKVES